jgi:hypothetical protein
LSVIDNQEQRSILGDCSQHDQERHPNLEPIGDCSCADAEGSGKRLLVVHFDILCSLHEWAERQTKSSQRQISFGFRGGGLHHSESIRGCCDPVAQRSLSCPRLSNHLYYGG